MDLFKTEDLQERCSHEGDLFAIVSSGTGNRRI